MIGGALLAFVVAPLASAAAPTIAVVPEQALVPGLPAAAWVVVGSLDRAPALRVDGGSVTIGAQVGGAWRATLSPDPDAAVMVVEDAEGGRVTLPVGAPPGCGYAWSAPSTVSAGQRSMSWKLTGPVGATPHIVASDGVLAAVTELGPGKFEVGLDLAGVEERPGFLVVGAYRGGCAPTWNVATREASLQVPFVTEPGAQVTITVAARTFGPWVAGPDGEVTDVNIVVGPADRSAAIEVVDDLGNVTRGVLPLSLVAEGQLVAVVDGVVIPNRSPPRLYGLALAPDGSPAGIGSVGCRLPGTGLIPIFEGGDGTFVASLPTSGQVSDRVRCGGVQTSRTIAVPASSAVPARLEVTAAPQEMSAQIPLARVRVLAEDAYGERVEPYGLEIVAEHGTIERVDEGPDASAVARFNYVGTAAVPFGGDILSVRASLPPGAPPVEAVVVADGGVSDSLDDVTVSGRAVDALGRPVAGVPLELSVVGGATEVVDSDERGWASRVLPVPPGTGPFVIRASSGAHASTMPVARRPHVGALERGGLETSLRLTFSGARTPGVVVEPAVLPPGGRAVVRVVPEGSVGLSLVAEGATVGPLVADESGVLVAELVADPGSRVSHGRLVLTAADGVVVERTFEVVPEPIRRGFGLAVGGVTNFGAIASPCFVLVAEARPAPLGQHVTLRGGVSTWGDGQAVFDNIGNRVDVKLSVWSGDLGLSWRQTFGARAVWIAAVAVVAAAHERALFEDEAALSGWRILTPGFGVLAGAGARVPGGELFVEARGVTLTSAGGDVAWQGPLGGLVGVLGYRVLY